MNRLLLLALLILSPLTRAEEKPQHLLYVTLPGIRNDLQYGGHGILVYDIDQNFKLLKRIPTAGLDKAGKPNNVKGVCASAATNRIYISTPTTLQAIDLLTEKLIWEKPFPGGCDRMSITPDSKAIYLPSFESKHWNVVDPISGDILATITPNSGAHNTLVSLDGRYAYLAGLKSKDLAIANAHEHKAVKTIPFTDHVRPFTVSGNGNTVYACVDNLLGFEIGDVESGKLLQRMAVEGFKNGPVKRHGCPSHGIGLTPDEKQLWLCDAFNKRLHLFDLTTTPPKQVTSIQLKDEPGWITFTLDGKYAIPSTGDIIDVASRKIITELKDETGRLVESEKVIEIHFAGGKPTQVGNQFGVGRVLPK